MDASLTSLMNLYVFTTGRRLYVLRRMLPRAEQMYPELVEPLRTAIRSGERVMEMETVYANQPPSSGNAEALATDNRLDQVLSAFYTFLCSVATAAPPDSANARAAVRVRDGVFKGGIQGLIQLTHPEEVEAVDGMLRKLSEYLDEIKTLAVAPIIDEVRRLNRQFRAALDAKRPSGVSYDEVRASQAKNQEELLGVVAMVMGRFAGFREGDVDKRSELLAPVMEQNEAIAAYRRSRRAVPDVEPSTGEETQQPAVTDAPTK
jgi:hypothetical protein